MRFAPSYYHRSRSIATYTHQLFLCSSTASVYKGENEDDEEEDATYKSRWLRAAGERRRSIAITRRQSCWREKKRRGWWSVLYQFTSLSLSSSSSLFLPSASLYLQKEKEDDAKKAKTQILINNADFTFLSLLFSSYLARSQPHATTMTNTLQASPLCYSHIGRSNKHSYRLRPFIHQVSLSHTGPHKVCAYWMRKYSPPDVLSHFLFIILVFVFHLLRYLLPVFPISDVKWPGKFPYR